MAQWHVLSQAAQSAAQTVTQIGAQIAVQGEVQAQAAQYVAQTQAMVEEATRAVRSVERWISRSQGAQPAQPAQDALWATCSNAALVLGEAKMNIDAKFLHKLTTLLDS